MKIMHFPVFRSWNLVRWIRLLLGVLLIAQAVSNHDSLSGILGAFLLFQALSNTGCCGSRNCEMPVTQPTEQSESIHEFQEIKIQSSQKK